MKKLMSKVSNEILYILFRICRLYVIWYMNEESLIGYIELPKRSRDEE